MNFLLEAPKIKETIYFLIIALPFFTPYLIFVVIIFIGFSTLTFFQSTFIINSFKVLAISFVTIIIYFIINLCYLSFTIRFLLLNFKFKESKLRHPIIIVK